MLLSSVYQKVFEQDCFELIVNAYSVAITEKKYQMDWNENDFSELLGNYVNKSSLSLDKRIICKTEQKLLSETNNLVKGYADKLPRIDFIYSQIWSDQKYCYYMEAKKLKEKDSDLKREYIKEGMDRFITKKYSVVGCMLGYLLEGTIEETIIGINSLLEKYERNNERLKHRLNEKYQFYYESNHSELCLKHLIFDFTVL